MQHVPATHELEPGAHLTTPRRGFVHHGLYVGEGRVIHYAGLDRLLRRGPVEEVTLAQFTRGRGFAVLPCVAPRFDAAAAIARARSRLGEDSYRLWSNNCEHFTEWCLHGVSRSPQVAAYRLRWRRRVSRVALALRLPLRGPHTVGALRG